MGTDEAGTLAALKQHRAELIEPRIAACRGRLFKLTGDGLLVEFPSVVNALSCAVEIQHGLRQRNENVPPERRIELRIGINLGDVLVECPAEHWGSPESLTHQACAKQRLTAQA
jgi:adenylate cyclase